MRSIHRPAQEGAEQDDGAEIAIGQKMRRRPQLDAGQHRMLQRRIDAAAQIGRDHQDDRGQHQRERDVLQRLRRIPDVDPARRTIMREAPDDQREPRERGKRIEDLVGPLAQSRDGLRARLAFRREHMRRKKQRKPQDHNQQTHEILPSTSAPAHGVSSIGRGRNSHPHGEEARSAVSNHAGPAAATPRPASFETREERAPQDEG